MKKLSMVVLGLAAFVMGMSVNNFAMSDVPPSYKVAVVDISQVVAASGQVKALKADQEKKASEIRKYVEKARNDVASVTDEKKKKALETKYTKELKTKSDTYGKEYNAKLAAIDANISKTIETQAKAKNYNVVLAKGVVLYGGDDITADVIKTVK